MKRRDYLLTITSVGTLTVSGCLGGGGDGNSESSEYEIDLETESDTLQESGTVESGEFVTYSLDVPFRTQMRCEIEITSGPAVSFMTMTQNEFNRYRDGEQFSFYQELSVETQKSITVDGELSSGKYRLVIDRTGIEFS
jgi:hypothetical protein